MDSMEYGKRFSTTYAINLKATLWLIPFTLVIIILLYIAFAHVLILILGSFTIMILFMFGTMGDQGNVEAFEYGLMIPISGRYFRDFVPYEDIKYICRYKFDRDINGLKINSEGILLVIKIPKSKSGKMQTYLMRDSKATPFERILPQIKIQNEDWDLIYYPETIFMDARKVLKFEVELDKNVRVLSNLIREYKTY
jgi:hypothetical protein